MSLTVIEQSLAHPLASPRLRSALYRVADRRDCVDAIERVKDPSGCAATVLRHTCDTNPGTVHTEVFFDPDTAATLGRRMGESTITDSRVYTRPETVPSLERPWTAARAATPRPCRSSPR